MAEGGGAQSDGGEYTFLSDIHVGNQYHSLSEQGTVISKFILSISDADDVEDNVAGNLDEDGDLIVPRKARMIERKVLLIEHAMSTVLHDVGQQIWRGALVLADFLLHCRHKFKDGIILELGGGVGLVSIVASQFCKLIFCTDIGNKLLDICQRNVERNSYTFHGTINVKQLNWHNPFKGSSENKDYQWQISDIKKLEEVQFILAADVVYDDMLTSSFMNCLVHLNYSQLNQPAIIYIAIEKRINFTLEEMAPAIPAYKYFRECLTKQYYTDYGDSIHFEAEPLDLSKIPQCFDYNRVKEMELWKIQTIKSNAK